MSSGEKPADAIAWRDDLMRTFTTSSLAPRGGWGGTVSCCAPILLLPLSHSPPLYCREAMLRIVFVLIYILSFMKILYWLYSLRLKNYFSFKV